MVAVCKTFDGPRVICGAHGMPLRTFLWRQREQQQQCAAGMFVFTSRVDRLCGQQWWYIWWLACEFV